MKSKKNGFTLLEVILTIMIMSIVFLVVSNVFSLTIRANRVANDEFDLQSNMRIVSESLNQSIKFSPALFTLKKETFQAEKKSGWRYFGIEDENAPENTSGNKQVVEYIPIIESDIDGVITYKTEGDTHTRKILLDEPDGTKFNLYFQKDITAENGKLLEFVIEGVQDNNIQRKMTVKTQLQAINAMVVEHAGDPAVAIAYKEEVPGKRVKGTQEAYSIITLALDRSNSMNNELKGEKKIDILNEKTNELINKLKKTGGNIYIKIIPYDTNVDEPNGGLGNFEKIENVVYNNISTPGYDPVKGGTNTGEALLKSYNMLTNSGLTIPPGAKVNYYNILLTDGEPTHFSYYTLKNGDKSYQTSIRNINNWIKSKNNDDFYFRDSWKSLSYKKNSSVVNVQYNTRQDQLYEYIWVPFFGDIKIDGWGVYSMDYVKRIGKDLISNSELKINSYIIGFGDGMDLNSKKIAFYCIGEKGDINNPLNQENEQGKRTNAYYSAVTSDQLEFVYNDLVEIIKGDMWHVMGPY